MGKSKKVLLLVETDESLIKWLKKKVSEPRGMVLSQFDGKNCIVYNVIEDINEECIIADLNKLPCPYSSIIGGEVTCFISKYNNINQYPRCDRINCPRNVTHKGQE